jgi:predicted RND superfamily exporter protein
VQGFSRFVLRRAGFVALVGTLLAILGGYYSVLLYKNLRTEVQELLPTTARSVIDLHEVTERLESIDNLGVLVFSQQPRASKRFIIALAEKLKDVPKNVIASVEYKIDQELKFFKDRQALYIDLPDLIRVRDYIHDRIEYEKELYNPLNIFREADIPEPKLDFLALKTKYKGKTSGYERLPGGYYATPDETKRVLLVNMPGQSSGIAGAYRLRDAVDKAIRELNPKSYASDIEIKYTGGVEDQIEEQSALVADLELSTVIVTLVVTLGMLAFYRTLLATLALMTSLIMGTLWTFGVSYFAVGYLNANSAFLGSIVIGNGINFGIIYLARYLEERRKGRNNTRATRLSMQHTATSTWTAALAAGLSYGSLVLTGFRGFKQFGVIGLIGMILCWISAFTLLPAYLTLLDRRKSLLKNLSLRPPKPYIAGAIAAAVGKFPKVIWGLSFIATLLSVATLSRFNPSILETDLSKLRNKESMTTGSAYLSKYLDEIFQRFLSPLVILPDSRENAIKIAALLKEKKEKEGKMSLIASVQTLDDFLPFNQIEKIKVLKEIKALLPPKLLRRLSVSDQKLVGEFLTDAVMKPIRQKDLPPLVLSKFTEKNGTIGKMVLVEPPLTNETRDGDKLIQFIDDLRSVADSVEPGAPVAGSLAISSDMIRAISHDGPRATLFAFVAVFVLIIFLFRNLKTISLVLFSLMLGVTWLAGLILGFDLKINFLNFIALPITFGIGVDYGVNVFQRYRETGGGNILNVIRNTGSAVGLCSFSTIIGYTSLLIASNQGFVSFGLLAVVGELTCVVAAVVSLPAYLMLRERKQLLKALK